MPRNQNDVLIITKKKEGIIVTFDPNNFNKEGEKEKFLVPDIPPALAFFGS